MRDIMQQRVLPVRHMHDQDAADVCGMHEQLQCRILSVGNMHDGVEPNMCCVHGVQLDAVPDAGVRPNDEHGVCRMQGCDRLCCGRVPGGYVHCVEHADVQQVHEEHGLRGQPVAERDMHPDAESSVHGVHGVSCGRVHVEPVHGDIQPRVQQVSDGMQQRLVLVGCLSWSIVHECDGTDMRAVHTELRDGVLSGRGMHEHEQSILCGVHGVQFWAV